jgi:glycosyltransferase involved in cell wall biosynthesis
VLGSGNVNIVFYSKTFLLFNEGVYGENIEAAFAMLCGLREVVKGAGILFNTEEELKNAIISLLNNNALYEEISQKCRDRAERYDIKRMAEDLIKLYSGGSNS